MDKIILPNGSEYSANYAGEDAAQAVFSASLITNDVVAVVQDFTSAESFTVENPHTGEKTYAGYTNLYELHLLNDTISIFLRKEG